MSLSWFKMGVKDPSSALLYLTKGKEHLIKKMICQITQKSFSEITEYYEQIKKSDFIPQYHEDEDLLQIRHPQWLYTICRAIKPKVVVETGVASGFSSSFILKALDDNNYGKLVSIDMPGHDRELVEKYKEYSKVKIPDSITNKKSGWIVPQFLKKRWTLKIGTTQELVIPTLRDEGVIDIYLRDSEHIYKTMMFEFESAWSHLKKGGILLSDDIHWNSSFMDFSKKVDRKYTEIYFTGAGAILKEN